MSVEIIFDAPAIGRQQLDIALDPASFRAELADARTFGFIAEVEQLRAAGYGRGASLDNTIVVDGDHLLNPGGLRRPDEFVRHKAMDALGDLALLGAPISAATKHPAAGTRSITRSPGRCWPNRGRGATSPPILTSRRTERPFAAAFAWCRSRALPPAD